jgi:hypothetical protein
MPVSGEVIVFMSFALPEILVEPDVTELLELVVEVVFEFEVVVPEVDDEFEFVLELEVVVVVVEVFVLELLFVVEEAVELLVLVVNEVVDTLFIIKLAVGELPSEVGTAFVPALLPVVGTFAQVSLAVFVVLLLNVQPGDTVEPGTVTVIGVLGRA